MNDRQQDRARAELAAVPPREFRRARQALALRLAKAGEARAAAAVRKITRPTVPVWMVNRLAREATPAVEQLVKTAGRMRAAALGGADARGSARGQEARGTGPASDGTAHGHVVELHPRPGPAEQEAAAAHVTSTDEIRRETQALAQDLEEGIEILAGGNAAQQ